MNTVKSFAPIENAWAHTLILGSMPGISSLNANQYYAHPRNAFWRITGQLFNFSAEAPYEERVLALKAAGVAVWDVLQSCVREGSLDSAIEVNSRIPNDFAYFFKQHPHIRVIGLNGAEAEKSFKQLVKPQLDLEGIQLVRLPSSSPAHTLSLDKKIEAWRVLLALRQSTL